MRDWPGALATCHTHAAGWREASRCGSLKPRCDPFFGLAPALLTGLGHRMIPARGMSSSCRRSRSLPCLSLLLLLLPLRSFAANAEKRRLNFRDSDGQDSAFSKFKIVQITDIHLGEWTADQKDPETYQAIRTYLSIEQPDLIVLSGDMVSSEDIQYNADDYLKQLASVLEPFDIPWCYIFGNHDVAWYHYDYNGYSKANVRRGALVQVDRANSLSLTQDGPPGIFGKSNYWLDILDSSNTFVASRLLLLDTGGGMLPEQLDASQVDWFKATNDPNIATFCFQHLPTDDMEYSSNKCTGQTLTGMIDPISGDAGMMQALQDAGNVIFVAVGHNHGNSYCCPFNDSTSGSNHWWSMSQSTSHMHYCFGRQSGYGGSPAFSEHGARVYELGHDKATGKVHWRSYIRTERGRVIDEYYPE